MGLTKRRFLKYFYPALLSLVFVPSVFVSSAFASNQCNEEDLQAPPVDSCLGMQHGKGPKVDPKTGLYVPMIDPRTKQPFIDPSTGKCVPQPDSIAIKTQYLESTIDQLGQGIYKNKPIGHPQVFINYENKNDKNGQVAVPFVPGSPYFDQVKAQYQQLTSELDPKTEINFTIAYTDAVSLQQKDACTKKASAEKKVGLVLAGAGAAAAIQAQFFSDKKVELGVLKGEDALDPEKIQEFIKKVAKGPNKNVEVYFQVKPTQFVKPSNLKLMGAVSHVKLLAAGVEISISAYLAFTVCLNEAKAGHYAHAAAGCAAALGTAALSGKFLNAHVQDATIKAAKDKALLKTAETAKSDLSEVIQKELASAVEAGDKVTKLIVNPGGAASKAGKRLIWVGGVMGVVMVLVADFRDRFNNAGTPIDIGVPSATSSQVKRPTVNPQNPAGVMIKEKAPSGN